MCALILNYGFSLTMTWGKSHFLDMQVQLCLWSWSPEIYNQDISNF